MTTVAKRIFAKLDAAFYENPRVIRAGRNGREVYQLVLVTNASHGASGEISASNVEPWYVAHRLGINEADAADGVTKAVTAGLISIRDDVVTILGWNDEWSRGPKSDAQRAKEYRASRRERHESSRTDRDASRDDRGVTQESREEESRERGARDAPGSLSLDSDPGDPATETRSGERASRRRATKATGLPQDWEPSTEAVALAHELGLDVQQEAAKFVDRMRSGDRKSADWQADFRNWLRRGAEFQERNGKRKPKPGATRRAAITDVVLGVNAQSSADAAHEVQQGSEPRKRET